MADQILSQEEVDALLSSMASGQLDFEEDGAQDDVSSAEEFSAYDLTSPNIMMREHFDVLDEIHDRFANSLRISVTTTLRMPIDAELTATETVKFGEFMEGIDNPTSLHTFRMEPLIGSGLLVIEPRLVFFLIDCMFGGTGMQEIKQQRDFTVIEQRVMRKFTADVLKELEKAWSFVEQIKISIGKSETKPQFIRLVAPNDIVVVVLFTLSIEGFNARMWLCIPYLLLEPIRDKLSYKHLRDSEMESLWGSKIEDILNDTPVKVSARIGNITQSIGDILSFQKGDLILLDTGPPDSIPILVENVPKFLGSPGIVGGNRAVRIEEPIFPLTGKKG
ncbi:MAG: flagellar motor switch protein FliM [Deltaproteobacteria bacterium]|nr:flagellar motor switch protein FliM [Deltaproteobacteria bacterium]